MRTFSTLVSGCRRAGAPATVLDLLVVAAPPARAAVVHYVNVSASSGTIQAPGPPNSGLFNGLAPSLVSTSSIESSSSAQGYESGNASAENAAVHADANATRNPTLNGWGTYNGAAACSAYGKFQDLFELHSASFANGTQVRMTFGVLVDGAVSGTGAGESRDGPPDSYISNQAGNAWLRTTVSVNSRWEGFTNFCLAHCDFCKSKRFDRTCQNT